MEEVKGPPCDKDSSSTSSSSSFDLRDYDFPDLDWEIRDLPPFVSRSILNETKEDSEPKPVISPSGLFMHTSPEYSGVEEIVTGNERLHHYESNSSSDIDVIDECLEDSQGSMSIPTMDISFCTSDISSTMSASQKENTEQSIPSRDSENQTDEIPSDPVPPTNQRTFFEKFLAVARLIVDTVNAFQRDRSLIDYFVIVSIFSVCVILPISHIVIKKASWQRDKLAQMEGHIDKLQSENIHLKNKVLSKIESGKLFGELDEEMRDLKAENLKLHKAMQTVIRQLEEQTHAIKRGIEVKEQKHPDSYKKEIAKLKEQINMLRIDNEELQTQLVRIRYGKHPILQDNTADKYVKEKKESESKFSPETAEVGQKKDSTFDKREEISEFRKKLSDEVAKLKNWEKLLEDFTKEIESPRDEGGFKKRRYSDERNDNEKQEDDKSKQKKQKSRKFYDWSWKEIQDNFKGTIENFPAVSDMISQYVLFDKQKVDGVLNSVGHYLKKAQDKTRKILESYSFDEKTQAVKDDIWTLLGEMKNKWVNMKKDFLQTHFGNTNLEKKSEFTKAHKDSNQEEEQVAPEVESKSPHLNVKDHSGDSSQEFKSKESDHASEENKFEDQYFFNPDVLLEVQENMDDMDEFNQLLREAQQMIYDRETNLDTWMFERARHRAELREEEGVNDDASNLNWYLRRAKVSKETDTDSTTENFYSAKKE